MKARYRPLDAPEEPTVPPESLRRDLDEAPPPVVRPPLSPPGVSRDRREERIRRFWAERERAPTARPVARPPPAD